MKLFISILTFMCLFFTYSLNAQSKFKDKSKRASLVEIEKVKELMQTNLEIEEDFKKLRRHLSA